MLESSIEAGLRKQVIKHGGLFLKFVSPSQAGVPDRIIIDNGRVIFVELKQKGEKPRLLQEKMIGRMRRHGADVRVVAGRDEAKALVKELWPEGEQIHMSMNPAPPPSWVRSYHVRAGARRAGKHYELTHRYPPEDGRGNFVYPDEEDEDDGV